MKPLFKTRYTTRQTTMTHKQSKSTIPYPESARIFTWLTNTQIMIIEVLLEVFYCCMFGITLGAQMYEFDIVVCS